MKTEDRSDSSFAYVGDEEDSTNAPMNDGRTFEKINLFYLLKTFFKTEGTTGNKKDLYDAFNTAKASGSHETYMELLGKLAQSPFKPGFIVESVPVGASFVFKVQFLCEENHSNCINNSSVPDNTPWQEPRQKNVLSSAERPVSDRQFRHMKSKIDHHDKKFDHHDEKFDHHEKKIYNHGADIENLREEIHRLKFANSEGKRPSSSEFISFVTDAFSFIMVKPRSLPAFSAWFIFFVQLTSYLLAVENKIFVSKQESEYSKSPPFEIPLGVGPSVHVGQGIALFITVLVQESMWESLADLSNGYNSHLKSQNITYIWWLVPNMLRILGAIVGIFVTYILVVTSDSTVELFKDLTAMLFVSSFDNILFVMARINALGENFKIVADEAEGVTYTVTSTPTRGSNRNFISHGSYFMKFILKCLVKPYMIALALYVILYSLWIRLVLRPHMNFDYLCQDIYIQLDDDVNRDLSFFSGHYKLLKNEDKRGLYPAYKEQKRSIENFQDRNPMILRYCESTGSWVFVLQNKNHDGECLEENILVRSSDAEAQALYNVFEVYENKWEVKYEDGRFMPFDDLYMACLDKESEENYPTHSSLCQEVEIDTRFEEFESSRSWSKQFITLTDEMNDLKFITVHDHLVYASKDKQDLLFFTGKRWVVTSVQDLSDLTSIDNLGFYLENDFHGMWSKFKVTFISESVKLNTPEDTLTPISLTWYLATPKVDDKAQVADHQKELTTSLLCSNCNKETNPCYFDGVCLDDQTCHCATGSTGTLCQITPTANGFCDVYFNSKEYNYDGGDCCISTCKSSNEYMCGRDITGSFYVGYESCQVNSCKDCWQVSELPISLKSLSTTQVSISESGRILGLIDLTSYSVKIYDNDGSAWRQRGSSVTRSENPTSDFIEVSGYYNGMISGNILTPVTVAFQGKNNVRIYDWNNNKNDWEEKWWFTGMTKVIHLSNSGKTFGIIGADGSFSLFRRGDFFMPWMEVYKHLDNEYSSFSLSMDGDKIALGSSQLVEIHNSSHVISSKSFSQTVNSVVLSPGGKVLVILFGNQGENGEVIRYNVANNTFVEMKGTLRGVSTFNPKLEIDDYGLTMKKFSPDENKLYFYQWKDSRWELIQYFVGQSPSFSYDGSVLAMTSFNQDVSSGSSGLLEIKHQNTNHCEKGTVLAYLSFIPDNVPEELSWELFVVTSFGDFISLKQGGPYEIAESMIIEKLCINDTILSTNEGESDRCLGIRIIDKGLDGMNPPGMAGLSVNETVIWSLNATNGYESILSIHGNRRYLDPLISKSPWAKAYDASLHMECQFADCEWKNIGRVEYKYDTQHQERFMEISSDGSIFALGNRDKGEVHLFKYNSTGDWVEYGSRITQNQTDSCFGHSVSLSSDGSIVAIGAPSYNLNGTLDIGQVRIYKYNDIENDWLQLGGILNGDTNSTEQIKFGWTLSLSADGTVVAVGIYSYSSIECLAYVYNYDAKIDEWVQRGNCLPAVSSPKRINVRLSGTGSVVAVASYDYMRVQIFQYDKVGDWWQQKGSDIEQTDWFFGWQMSLSSDGSVLAAACFTFFPPRVFYFNSDTDKWEQKGQLITVSGGEVIDLALSSNGSVLVITYDNIILTFIYDKLTNLWVESLLSVPEIEYSGNYPRLAVSADALVIAAKEDESISFYRLFLKNNSASQCHEDEDFFKFIIEPDQFPQDITWFLKSEKGTTLLGGQLPDNKDSPKESKQLVYQQCYSKSATTLLTFTIEDEYGDGICCEWGNGTFQVEWNHQVVLDSNSGFMRKEIVCIPNSSDISIYSIDIDASSGSTVYWALFDSTLSDPLTEGFISTVSVNNYNSKQCVPSLDCIIFVIFDTSGFGKPFTISQNNHILNEHMNDTFYIKKVPIGNCNVRQCQDGYSLFELDLGTDTVPHEIFWHLFDSNYTVLASRETGHYKEREKYYYFQECIPSETCVTLKIFDPSSDTRDTNYIVTLDGVIIQEDSQLDAFVTTIKMGKCNTPSCPSNYSPFELDVYTRFNPEDFTWQVLNSSDIVVMNGGNDYLPLSFYYIHECLHVMSGSCSALSLFDEDIINDAEIITMTWNGSFIENGLKLSRNQEAFLLCNMQCSEALSYNDFSLETDNQDFTWELVDPMNNTLVSGENYTVGAKIPECPSDWCATLRLHGTNDGMNNLEYRVSWNDDDFILIGNVIPLGNCSNSLSCPQNYSYFDMSIRTDWYPGEFSWELLDSNDNIIYHGGDYRTRHTVYHHRGCVMVSQNESATIKLYDSYGDGGTYYEISWNGNLIANGTQSYDSDPEFTMGSSN